MDLFDPNDAQAAIDGSYQEYADLAALVNNRKYITQKNSKWTNIIDQQMGRNFSFPFLKKKTDGEFLVQLPDYSVNKTPAIDRFFNLLEKCRLRGKNTLHYSERQYFAVAPVDHKYNSENCGVIIFTCHYRHIYL